ncbi:MAG: thiamine diphosphokinase [Lachnospiraceae bacterium]|nr:thiamine diphosphokinase [Lachnospiraceae bacterium]
MNGSCLLISGGEYADIPEDIKNADFVIACDRGWQHAVRMGIRPDLIMGDFDSAPAPDTDIPVMHFPSHKDDTDTMIAAREALSRGYKNVAVCCAFGARLDHTIANIQTAAFLVSNGAEVRLYGKDTEAYVFTKGSVILPVKPGYSLSLFSLSDKCEGIYIKGTEYECDDVTLSNTYPLGVSNEWASGEAHISVGSGILMVLCSAL